MTVLNPSSQRVVFGDGTTTFFPFDFELTPNFGLWVAVDGERLPFTFDDNGVTFATPPPDGARILIQRISEITQLINWEVFDEFLGLDTEDACDKLILLKEEAWTFLANMNLATLREIGAVTIENDKGTDARIELWSGEQGNQFAGVYNAVVTEIVPPPGSVLNLPDRYMFWQWGAVEDAEILTSWPYPVATQDTLESSIDFTSAAVGGTLFDTILEQSIDLVSLEVRQILKSEIVDDVLVQSVDLVSLEVDQILFQTTVEDTIVQSVDFVSAEVVQVVILERTVETVAVQSIDLVSVEVV